MTGWETCLGRRTRPGQVWRGLGLSRHPGAALFENLKDGATLDQFLAWFPGVASW